MDNTNNRLEENRPQSSDIWMRDLAKDGIKALPKAAESQATAGALPGLELHKDGGTAVQQKSKDTNPHAQTYVPANKSEEAVKSAEPKKSIENNKGK